MNTRTAALALTAILALAACQSGTSGTTHHAPRHSAATACLDFGRWVAAQNGDLLNTNQPDLLADAVSAAPSGHLYSDLTAFRTAWILAVAQKRTSQGPADRLLAITAAGTVTTDCQSVNTG